MIPHTVNVAVYPSVYPSVNIAVYPSVYPYVEVSNNRKVT